MRFHLENRAMSTLPQVLSAISHFHSKAHYPSPAASKAISRALEGAKRSFGKPSTSVNVITVDHLHALSALAYKPSCSLVVLRTVWRIFIEFYGLLRSNEVAQLTFSDLIWTSVGFDLFIKRSKTDQHKRGDFVSIYLPCIVNTILFTKV